MTRFNNGNVPYELQIQTSTTILNLGKYNLEPSSNVEPEIIQFYDVMNTSTRVGKLRLL